MAAEDNQIVITDIKMVGRETTAEENTTKVTLQVELNHEVAAEDQIAIRAFVNGVATDLIPLEAGAKGGEIVVNAKIGDQIKVVVDGTQYLARGVYFYAPKPKDTNGDGVATSREVAQNLVGVGEGVTDVYAEQTYVINTDKTATPLYEDKFTDVTLTVAGKGGEDTTVSDNLGVDIIYILGGFLSRDAIETNLMINSLIDTFREIIAAGSPVNFGIVPFSSTQDPVLPLTSLKTEADLAALPDLMAKAIIEAGDVYDGVNMENAIITAKEMFSASDLAKYPDRQHLVLISSGHTYYFNSGDNNEYISTVPVRFTKGVVDTDEIFYMEKAWMRARNNCTNSYPIPMVFVNEYDANPDKYESLWDCYWTYIDQWAKADIAAGDTVVYEATTRAAGDFIAWYNSGKYSSSTGSDGKGGTFTYTGHGAVITNPNPDDVENTLKFDLDDGGTQYGPNPFVYEYAAHAISYERAMWEAYQTINSEIVGAGIHFYPIYNPLRADGTASNGSTKYYAWCDQYIGHSFMNMLAGGEAITYASTNDKAFFAEIKEEIVESISSVGSVEYPYVVDYIGFGEDYDFDFTGNLDKLVLAKNGVPYKTERIAANTYTFTAYDAATPSFELVHDLVDRMVGEKFVWRFNEILGEDDVVTLTYQLELMMRSKEVGEHAAKTNQIAVLYPEDQLFPVPEVTYQVEKPEVPTVSFRPGQASNISFMLIDKASGKVEFLYKIDIGNETSFEIPHAEDKVSAVFIKQSASGMFWFEEELDEDLVNAAIECLKANNPSYKGNNAIAFGAGDHTLEFKKNKFATYTFTGAKAAINDEPADEFVDDPVVEEIPEEPEVMDPEVEEPIVEEPVLIYAIKGTEITSWAVMDGVTAIYVAAEGKIPAVVWTSVEVDEAVLAAFLEMLDADEDAVQLYGVGAHKIEYQQNKNKVKTVTYTFELAE